MPTILQAAINKREEEVARLSQPSTKEALSEQQLARIQKQEAEIAELSRRLQQSNAAQSSQAAPDSATRPVEQSSYERHHLFDMPAASKARIAPRCRSFVGSL